ncbi:Protein RNA-directed DNA methylation 3, partial [Mucuna pruriens]
MASDVNLNLRPFGDGKCHAINACLKIYPRPTYSGWKRDCRLINTTAAKETIVDKQYDINEACQGILYIYATRAVLDIEVHHLFSVQSRTLEIFEGMRARIKGCNYKRNSTQMQMPTSGFCSIYYRSILTFWMSMDSSLSSPFEWQ